MGTLHPDLQRAVDMAEAGMYAGVIWGGIIGSREAVASFKNNNDTTLFFGNKDAVSQLNRKSLLGSGIGALKVAPVFAAFTGGFTLFTSCVQAYRLKQGILEYCIGGFMIGSLFRIHYGFKGIIVGGVVASLLGGIYGAVELSVFKILGTSPTEGKFLIASYKRDVSNSIASTYYASGQTPAHAISESPPNSSQSSSENTKTENKT